MNAKCKCTGEMFYQTVTPGFVVCEKCRTIYRIQKPLLIEANQQEPTPDEEIYVKMQIMIPKTKAYTDYKCVNKTHTPLLDIMVSIGFNMINHQHNKMLREEIKQITQDKCYYKQNPDVVKQQITVKATCINCGTNNNVKITRKIATKYQGQTREILLEKECNKCKENLWIITMPKQQNDNILDQMIEENP